MSYLKTRWEYFLTVEDRSAIPTTTTNVLLSPDLPSSLRQLHQAVPAVHRTFIIGGASLYTESLLLPPSSTAVVDRILLTRIMAPSFDDCDVFMPDFQNDPSQTKAPWKRALHQELQEWVGFEVPKGIQEEKGIQYEFQMWTRICENA